MLQQQLPLLEASGLEKLSKWAIPALTAAVALTVLLISWSIGQPVVGLMLAVLLGAGIILLGRRSGNVPLAVEALPAAPDFSVIGAAMGLCAEPAALTSHEGTLLIANPAYRERFGAAPPLALGADEEGARSLELARTMACRDSAGCVTGVEMATGKSPVEVERVGVRDDLLLWRFPQSRAPDAQQFVARWFGGDTGQRLGDAGVLAALVGPQGEIITCNEGFSEQVGTQSLDEGSATFLDLIAVNGSQAVFRANPERGPMRLIHLPVDPATGAGAYLMFADNRSEGSSESNLQALLDVLPIGLALVDRDGRFITMNQAFRVAGGIKGSSQPTYPGDLVIKDDKAAVADAVRRNARGPAMSGDLAVRLARDPTEPVALTIAGLRGLGDPAVLLLLKDNSEEAKLKRQIAQATKMQVVGQLAGGVAHDFNNILTAIIGHCDLMLMRHTPGDSDYDDIQQIKSNSNRAAGLTRQLLAFSRQQTLRPQVLQLPDVISEVSHLLKRLLGETVQLVVKHGRNLGPVRADPGQLEQVIVNLAVNARDAMASQGGGTLTIQTYSVRADQVAELGSEILPVADYSALSVMDTGCGIPPHILSKVFDPFFTTKEVGKGTGLGLSTVYGIVKQSGGFIFADSRVGEGTRFVIYLPVHREEKEARAARKAPKPKQDELWGSGTVLLVEDEPMVRSVAERALTRHGYKVITADNGEEALEVLGRADEDIALLISDVVMPVMDGPTMVREARKSRPNLKILFMSGYAEEQLRNSIDIDDVAFLPKPFSVQELAEAARRVLAAK
jgi:two-component system cell cycle sensor histidine kinase/response regulator CckA